MPKESTTPDLVERTRRIFDAADRRDLDLAQSFYAPDAVWETVSLGTGFEGPAAIRGFFEDWFGAYEEYEMQPEEIADLGDGVVFVVVRLTARPLGSAGSALVRRRPLAFAWVEGMVAQATAYADSIDEARAAAERLAESRRKAMSHENVEIARRLNELFNAGDLDTYISEFVDPDVEWHTSAEDPDAATHHGAQAFRRYLEQWMDSFDGLRADVEEYIAVGDDRVFTWSRWNGRGRTSGAGANWHLAIIFTMREGRVVQGEEYFDRAETLEAVGLEA